MRLAEKLQLIGEPTNYKNWPTNLHELTRMMRYWGDGVLGYWGDGLGT